MRLRVIGVLVGTALVVPGLAPAADKSQSTMVNPAVLSAAPVPTLTGPISAAWQNGVSKGKVQGDAKCKIAVQMAGLAISNSDGIPGTGDEVICLTDSQVTQGAVPLVTTLVRRGEIKSGKVQIKQDLTAEGAGCSPSGGGSNAKSYLTNTACYEPDPTYAPAIIIPFASDPTQGIILGTPPRPASPLIATEGIYFQ